VENVDRNLEEQIRSLRDRTSLSMDRRILSDLAGRLQEPRRLKPTSLSAGIWRMIMISKRIKIATAAVVALAVLLPVSYGTIQVVKRHFTVSQDKVSFEYPDPNRGATTYVYGRSVSVAGTYIENEEQARARVEEFRQLYLAGKAVEVEPGIWKATLADGTEFAYGGRDPARAGAGAEFTEEEKAQLKKQSDEINELRKAGKGERTFLEEIEENGAKIRLYQVRYTLSDGRVVTITEGLGQDGSGGDGSGSDPLR
jgi:hypothetical protein